MSSKRYPEEFKIRYAFILAHEAQYPVRRLCHVMAVHPSGYYAWKTEPAPS